MKDSSKIKQLKRRRRRTRVRAKISGTAQKPRLSVFRSLKHICAQLIDDHSSKTLLSANDQELGKEIIKKQKTEVAFLVGELLAQKAQKKKITNVVFDRSAYKYHGRIKCLAEGAKKGGLKF